MPWCAVISQQTQWEPNILGAIKPAADRLKLNAPDNQLQPSILHDPWLASLTALSAVQCQYWPPNCSAMLRSRQPKQ